MATTLGDLRDRVRSQTDTENSEFVTDVEIFRFINDELGELADLLNGTSEDYNITGVQSTISSTSTNLFELPEDFLQARGVDRDIGGRWVTLRRYEQPERNRYSAVRTPGTVRYRIMAGACVIIPAESSVGTYQLWYVPRFIPLADGDATLPDYIDTQAWHAFAVAGACARVQRKQDLDDGPWMAEKARQQARVLSAAKVRDAGPPKRMVDVRSARWRWGRDGYYGDEGDW